MTRRKTSGKQSSSREEHSPTRQPPVSGVLDGLTSAEASFQRLVENLVGRLPEWEDLFRRIAERGIET